MDTGTSIEATTDLPRAGFWRRWLGMLIDTIVVMFPFQILAAILFALTAGTVQMEKGFYRSCADSRTIPQALDPAPPHDSNFSRVCHISFFGAPTGAILIVGRTARQGNTTTTVTQAYMLDRDGKPIHGISIDWIVSLAFVFYLIGMVWKTGRPVGARIVGVRVIDTAAPGGRQVPLGKVIIRYLALTIGFVPMFAVLIYQYLAQGGNVDATFTAQFFQWFMYAGAFAFLWFAVLAFQIAMKRDPVYDRLAGTAVVLH